MSALGRRLYDRWLDHCSLDTAESKREWDDLSETEWLAWDDLARELFGSSASPPVRTAYVQCSRDCGAWAAGGGRRHIEECPRFTIETHSK